MARKNEITSDKGYISYDELAPGDNKSFVVFSPNVGTTSGARIEPVFEDSFILACLMKKTGPAMNAQHIIANTLKSKTQPANLVAMDGFSTIP